MTALKVIYCAFIHSLMEYGPVFWGQSTESIRAFQVQKKIIKIVTGSESRISCKPLFQSSEIWKLPSQYILYLKKFLSHNLEVYAFDFRVYGINTRNKLQLHKLTTNLILYQKGLYCMIVEIFNELPEYVAELVVDKKTFYIDFEKVCS
jgi:hypothetical protein